MGGENLSPLIVLEHVDDLPRIPDARPEQWYIREQVEASFPNDKVFAVYLNPNMRVYECRAEYVADDDPFAPEDWQERYRGLTWKSTS